MKLAFATTFNAQEVRNWSGTPFYMASNIKAQGVEVDYFGSFKRELAPFFKLTQLSKAWFCDQRESPRFNITAAKAYSRQLKEALSHSDADVILAPLINPIAYLDIDRPIYLWTDALYASLVGFYEPFSRHSASTIQQGNTITRECLNRCKLAFFSSDWAARSAIELYGMSPEKVRVVPFGANLTDPPAKASVIETLEKRSRETLKLLFLAKSWERKGGDIVLAVTDAIHKAGYPVELHVVGYEPPVKAPLPSYVHCHGFISKQTVEGREKLRKLISDSHFLFVPSRAEAYGIVFCEANAFGVPCLTTNVGGINTVIQNGVNGLTFGLDATPEQYLEKIMPLFQNHDAYHAMSMNALEAFHTRLNWTVACEKVIQEMKGR